LEFHGSGVQFPDRWGRDEFRALKKIDLSEPLRISLDIFLTQLEELWVHQVALRAALRKLCKKERYHKAYSIARSLPGIGWFTAIRFVLELGEDLTRFTSGKKIASFVGLTSSEDSTGERLQKGRITGMGPGFIRATPIENSWGAIRKDPVSFPQIHGRVACERQQEKSDCRGGAGNDRSVPNMHYLWNTLCDRRRGVGCKRCRRSVLSSGKYVIEVDKGKKEKDLEVTMRNDGV
jgi:transposase IS116/IS110/IS902 family protein